jgi:hypothetical protein
MSTEALTRHLDRSDVTLSTIEPEQRTAAKVVGYEVGLGLWLLIKGLP